MWCSLVRWQLSSRLDDRAGAGHRVQAIRWGRRHLARCEGCSRFAERLDLLDRRLAREVARAEAPVAAEAGGARGGRSLPHPVLTVGAAVAVAAMVALAGRALVRSERRVAPVHLQAGAEGDGVGPLGMPVVAQEMRGAGPEAQAPAADASVTAALVAGASDLFSAPPLRSELSNLAHDGERGALAVLDRAGLGHEARSLLSH